jgi:RimK family alpha-L-glutamate ligase
VSCLLCPLSFLEHSEFGILHFAFGILHFTALPMRIVILSARRGWHTDQLVHALGTRGHVAVVLPYEGLVAGLGMRADDAGGLASEAASILDADAVIARIIPNGTLEQVVYRVDALHWIEACGVPVMNPPRTIERCVDKFYTSALLQRAGLRVPETVVCERIEDALAAVRRMGDVIIKPIFGSMGHGMVRIDNVDVAFRILRSLAQTGTVFYVQRAIEHNGSDVRVLVAGGHVVGAIARHARPGEWRTNVAQGGTAHPLDLRAGWADIALRASAAVGADYAGVDLLPSPDGEPYVLEVNGVPAWQGLQQATGIDIASALVDCLLDRIAARPMGVNA